MAFAVEAAAMYAVQQILAPSALNYVMTSFESFLANNKDNPHKSVAKVKEEVTRLVPRTRIEFIQQLSIDVTAYRMQACALQKLFEKLAQHTREMNATVFQIDCKIQDFQSPWYRRPYYGIWSASLEVETLLNELKVACAQFQQAYELLESWFPKLEPLLRAHNKNESTASETEGPKEENQDNGGTKQ